MDRSRRSKKIRFKFEGNICFFSYRREKNTNSISEELKEGNKYLIEFNLKNILILDLNSNILKQEIQFFLNKCTFSSVQLKD